MVIGQAAGLSGLNGCACHSEEGLGRVAAPIEELVRNNEDNLDEIIRQIETNAGISENNVFSFEEIDLLYNKGITADEKKAWVFYKRRYKNTPMHGWERYFIDINDQIEIDKLVMAGALYYNKAEFVPYPVFAWGNMYDRRLETLAAKDLIVSQYSEQVYRDHLTVINKHMPAQFRVNDPDKSMRPSIIPTSSIARHFKISDVRPEYSNVEDAEMLDKAGKRVMKKKRVSFNLNGERTIRLIDIFKKWLHLIDKKRYFKKGVHPNDIVNYYLDGFPISGGDKELSPAEQAEIKSNAREEGNRLFMVFLNEVLTDEDLEKLNDKFNQKYNGWSDLNYSRIPIGFEMSSTFLGGGFAIRPEKREAIAYMEAVGSGILAYDVGVGKTVSALLELASALAQGKCQRPLVVVPNPTYNNWLKEAFGGVDKNTGEAFNGILSGTGIGKNDWYNLGSAIEKKLGDALDVQVAGKTVTFITYEGFLKLGFSRNVANDFLDEMKSILMDTVDDPEFATEHGLGGTERDDTLKEQKILEVIGRGQAKSIADIDTLGFDYIVIDEAHRCKNIFEGVSADSETGQKNYSLQGATSTTGIKAFFVCNYIQRTFGGNVMLLTATPFTNSPLEIFSMLSLVGLELLQQNGYYNLNDFFKNFVKPKNEFVVKQNGDVVMKEVIKGFENIMILQRLIFTKINYKTGDDVGVKRPCKVNLPLFSTNDAKGNTKRLDPSKQKLTYITMNEHQQRIQARIIQGFNNIRGPQDKGMLMRYLSESLNNAFSPYLVGKSVNSPLRYAMNTPADHNEFVNNSPKVKYAIECIRSVKEHHEGRNEEISGQVIYSNRGIYYFPMIRDYLIEHLGFKKSVEFNGRKVSEVMILAGGKESSRVRGVPPSEVKEFVKDAFQAGVVKVLIGSATIREGINLQKRGTAIYNLYPDWNPTDVRQLEGRIWRQGNRYGFVRMVLPLVADSMDVFVFQKLEEKTSRINNIFFREGKSNVLDLDEIDPGEIKYALISDVNKIAKIDFTIERETAQKSISILAEDYSAIKDLESDLHQLSQHRIRAIETIKSAIDTFNLFVDEHADMREPDIKKQVSRAKKFVTDIEEYLHHKSDQVLAGFKVRLRNWPYASWQRFGISAYDVSRFSDSYKVVVTKEKQILKPKGYSLNANFQQVSEAIKHEYDTRSQAFLLAYGSSGWSATEIEKSAKELERKGLYHPADNPEGVKAPQRWLQIVQEIIDKKQRLRVKGEPVSKRVKEFAALNYLLTYGIKDVDLRACPLPAGPAKRRFANNRPPKESDRLKLKLKLQAQAKARAILILMEMEGLGGIKNHKINTESVITRADYPGIFEDFDNDGVPNVDDPNPLQAGDDSTIEEVRLSDEFGKLIDLRNELQAVKVQLLTKVQGLSESGTVKARAKTPMSIVNKLVRKRLTGRKGLTDQVGAMLIVKDQTELDIALNKIKSGKLGKILEHEDFYQVPLNGYRAHHFVIEVGGIASEVQLKTKRMKALSAASHTPYKNGVLDAKAMARLSNIIVNADAGDAKAIKTIDKKLSNMKLLQKELTISK